VGVLAGSFAATILSVRNRSYGCPARSSGRRATDLDSATDCCQAGPPRSGHDSL